MRNRRWSLNSLAYAMAATLVAPCALVAQNAQLAREEVVRGPVLFSVPSTWRTVREREEAGFSSVAYHIPNASLDSFSAARTNVIVTIRIIEGAPPFNVLTDSLLGYLIDPSMIVLEDNSIASQRSVFWRGEGESSIYAGYDDLALVGEVLVHVRIAVPLHSANPTGWSERLEEDTASLLESVLVNGTRAFPEVVGYPALRPIG